MAFDWKNLIPIFETAGNIAETALAPEFLPLTQAGEAALNPILLKIGTGQSVNIQTEVMAFYATAIAGWNLAKTKAGLDPATSAKFDQYIAAATNAMNAYFAAGQGFDAKEFVPVTPIVIPPAQ